MKKSVESGERCCDSELYFVVDCLYPFELCLFVHWLFIRSHLRFASACRLDLLPLWSRIIATQESSASRFDQRYRAIPDENSHILIQKGSYWSAKFAQ